MQPVNKSASCGGCFWQSLGVIFHILTFICIMVALFKSPVIGFIAAIIYYIYNKYKGPNCI
jgi:hypothetical protein